MSKALHIIILDYNISTPLCFYITVSTGWQESSMPMDTKDLQKVPQEADGKRRLNSKAKAKATPKMSSRPDTRKAAPKRKSNPSTEKKTKHVEPKAKAKSKSGGSAKPKAKAKATPKRKAQTAKQKKTTAAAQKKDLVEKKLHSVACLLMLCGYSLIVPWSSVS